MKTTLSPIHNAYNWVILLLRSIIGITVVKVGYDIAAHDQYLPLDQSGTLATGLFVMIIGCYFVFSSLFKQFFEN